MSRGDGPVYDHLRFPPEVEYQGLFGSGKARHAYKRLSAMSKSPKNLAHVPSKYLHCLLEAYEDGLRLFLRLKAEERAKFVLPDSPPEEETLP